MDTGTHVVMGVALTGLATLDPHVTPTFAAVATGIMVGSQIPDIDTVLKLKNNLKNKYEINQKAIAKLYRKHNTSDRLKRYLEFGRR